MIFTLVGILQTSAEIIGLLLFLFCFACFVGMFVFLFWFC